MADHNRYSVDARAAGRMVLVRSHAERVVVLLGEDVVADHPRNFQRDKIVYDPWRYLPALVKKPGALRYGAPFKDWDLPPALTQVRAKLKPHADGDRQFVKILGAVLDHGFGAVEAACVEALEAGLASGDVILTVLARRGQPAPSPSITTPDALRLEIEPNAAVNTAREAGETALPPNSVAAFVERYWDGLKQGHSFHRHLPELAQNASVRRRPKQREGKNLIERLKTFKTETLRFLNDFDVPFLR